MAEKKDIVMIGLELPDGSYAMQRRDADAPTSPNKLTFFGGSVEDYDGSILEAIVRELQEETDIDFDPNDIEHVVDFPRTGTERTTHLFLLRLGVFAFSVFEGVGMEAYSLEEIMTRSDVTGNARIAAVYLQRRKEMRVVDSSKI